MSVFRTFTPFCLCFALATTAQARPAKDIAAAATVHHTTSGFEEQAGNTVVRVDALRPDLLRVRVYHPGHMPEDASWAVLPASRTAAAKVQSTADGFTTTALHVTLSKDLKLTITDPEGHVLVQDAAPIEWKGTGFRIQKVHASEEHFFGLGDNPGPLDRTGMSFALWNTDHFGFQESTDPIYKSIPFFVSMNEGRSVGVFFDNTYRSYFDLAHEDESMYSYSATNGPVDYYVMAGPDPKKVVEAYAWLTGPTPLPALWTLGFQQSRYSYMSQKETEEVAAHMRQDKIPVDAIYLDIDYQEKNRPFTVNTTAFPDFSGMIQHLLGEHIHTVAITDLHVAHLPNQGYTPYDSGHTGDHFLKMPNGQEYVGSVWPGPSVFPDFTQQTSRAWWGTLYQHFSDIGIAGFWNDMNEPAIFSYPTKTMPPDVQHRIDEPGFTKRTTDHLEIHNIYGMENSRGTYEGLVKLKPNVRPFVLTRASYAGGQRYAATWTGDNLSTWNHLKLSTTQLLNLGLSGFAMSGADVGGFGGSPSPELLTKWIELSAFQPIDRDHSAKNTRRHEVWVDGPEHEAIRRKYIEERYRLMPYLYTTAEEMSRTGLPITRPLFLEFPHATKDGHPLDLDAEGEFFFGGALLVAPSPNPDDVAAYEVHLPPGIWYDYWTNTSYFRPGPTDRRDLEIRETAASVKPLMVTPTLEELPVYVKGGSILPIAPLTQSTDEKPAGPLTLRIYPADVCAGTAYFDDGISYNFQQGAYLRLKFSCTQESDHSIKLTMQKPEGNFTPWFTQLRLEVAGWPADSVKVVPFQTNAVAWTLTRK